MLSGYIDISDEVRDAISSKLGVVALESTVISHGLPQPENIQTALNMEEIVRENGSIPATVAIINGRIKVGLSKSDIEFLTDAKNSILKVSKRDLAFVIAKGLNGASTVASTIIISELAGIRFFATGGIGGVHRGANISMDISADLKQLANSNTTVVCSGVKSILDIGLTLEYLETMGVTILGYKSDKLASFYTDISDYEVDYRVDNLNDVCLTMRVKESLNISGSILLSNPISREYSIDKKLIEGVIKDALKECDKSGVKGKEITPFLLSCIKDKTGGKSLKVNIELLLNNAKVASQLAKIYHQT